MKKIKIVILCILTIILIFFAILSLRDKELKIKNYKNNTISFNYTSNYKIVKKDEYIELANKNSNIYVDTRSINSIENSNSFASIVDNIIYEYLKKNPDSKLISKYDNYKFDDKNGYRLIFEDSKNKTKSLLLITLENLNLSMVTLNANSDIFELSIDSAELIMNSLQIKSNIKYFSVDNIYPEETFAKSDLLVSGDKEIIYDLDNAKDYTFRFDDDYELNVKVPSDFEIYDSTRYYVEFEGEDMVVYYAIDYLVKPEKYDEETGLYYSSYGRKSTPEGASMRYNYDYYGYKKYGEKTYYVALGSEKSKSGQKLWEYQLSEPLNTDYGITTIIATYAYNKITPELISKVMSYDFKYNPAHSKIEDGYIVGNIKIDNSDEKITVEYRIPEKYDISYGGTNYKSIKDNNKDLKAHISISARSPFSLGADYFNEENGYKDYQLKKVASVKKGDYLFERYIESYISSFANYTFYYIKEYYISKIDEVYMLVVEIEYPSSETDYAAFDPDFVDDMLNFKISTKNES